MLIADLIKELPPKSYIAFQGSRQIRIRGVGLNPRRRGVRRCLYVLPDPSWHPRYHRIYRRGRSDESEIKDAIRNGAAGLVLPARFRGSPLVEGIPVFFVNDTLGFLFRVGEVFRRSMTTQTLTAVTGSAGKSTVQRMIVHALEAADPEKSVQKVGNNRNLSSEALWRLSWAPLYGHTVIEQDGGSFPQLRYHQFAMSPDVAVVTSISEAHLTAHGDVERLVRNKSDIMADPPPGGAAVFNLDTMLSDRLIDRAEREGSRLFTYGESAGAAIRLLDYDIHSGTVVADIEGEQVTYSVGARGKHMALNSLAVLATLRALGVADWRAGAESLSTFEALPGRGVIVDAPLPDGGSVRITDESHNANPASMGASLNAFSSASTPGGRRIAVLGDMRELDHASVDSHQALSRIEGFNRMDQVHLVGEEISALYETVKHSHPGVHHWPNVSELIAGTGDTFQSGDAILVKGSAGVGLSQFVAALTSRV